MIDIPRTQVIHEPYDDLILGFDEDNDDVARAFGKRSAFQLFCELYTDRSVARTKLAKYFYASVRNLDTWAKTARELGWISRLSNAGRPPFSPERWRANFDVTYGEVIARRNGKTPYDVLVKLLDDNTPNVEIGEIFGARPQAVPEWRRKAELYRGEGFTDGVSSRKQRAFDKYLETALENTRFRYFYNSVKRHLGLDRLGYHFHDRGINTSKAKIDGKDVLIRKGQRRTYQDRDDRGDYCRLMQPKDMADYIFYRLEEGFLFVPYRVIDVEHMTYIDDKNDPLFEFRDRFDALGKA